MGAERRGLKQRDSAPQDRRERTLKSIRGYLADSTAAQFDRLVYERVRLGIMSALAVNASLSFSDLKDLLETSDGNLSAHARKLENAGYIECHKTFQGRVPHTQFQLTAKGRNALEKYLDHMEALIRATRD